MSNWGSVQPQGDYNAFAGWSSVEPFDLDEQVELFVPQVQHHNSGRAPRMSGRRTTSARRSSSSSGSSDDDGPAPSTPHAVYTAALEAINDGDLDYAVAILTSAVSEPPAPIRKRRRKIECPDCGIGFEHPGQAVDHARNLGHREWAA